MLPTLACALIRLLFKIVVMKRDGDGIDDDDDDNAAAATADDDADDEE